MIYIDHGQCNYSMLKREWKSTSSISHLSPGMMRRAQQGEYFAWGGDSDKEGLMRRAMPNEEGPDEEESLTRGKVLNEEGPMRSDGKEGNTQYCLPEKGMQYSQFFAINC